VKLRLDAPVSTSDGPFGEIGDVVIDPVTRTVTHLVVEPHHRHHQARLVPVGLVEATDDGIRVRLDHAGLRALQAVAESDFVRISEPIELADGWDVGIEQIAALPYTTAGSVFAEAPLHADVVTDRVSILYDRIPKGDCEIRRASHVVSSDDHTVGIVDGFVVDDTHVEGVIVRAGWIGLRHLVVVPVSSVSRVENDRITITLPSGAFHRLPPIDDPGALHVGPGRVERLEHSAARHLDHLRSRVRSHLPRRSPPPAAA
jgi:sporulation protein YlmC with PRC-barrel domain